MDLEDIRPAKIRRRSQVQVKNYDDNNTRSCLEKLPDELLLLILLYLNTVDIFRAFGGQNRRFNNLIYDCARHVTLPSDTTDPWCEQHIPQLEYRIKTICLNDKSLQCVFTNKWSFPTLQVINLQGCGWNVSLRLGEKPASMVLMSSLNFLQEIRRYKNPFSINTQKYIIDHKNDYSKTLSCPFIERLSIDIYSMVDLFTISTRLPNLTHLKVNYLVSHWYNVDYLNRYNFIERTTCLVKLTIITDKEMDFNLFEQFINSYKTSLKYLMLGIHCLQTIDGYYLERIFKFCEQLEKLVFLFEYNDKKFNIDACQRSFQSEWWLDTRRPSVYIQHNDTGSTKIATMPYQFPFTFENNLYNWYFNKGDQNSSFIRFTNINKIHFINYTHQPISLEYLYSLDRIFTSSYQTLCFDFCDLESVDILFELLMDDTSITPVLPNVKHFIVGSSNKLDSLMLSVWILLIPNLRKLNISNLTTFNKIELAKELKDMIDNDERLKSSFDHINKLIIFSQCNDVDTKTKNELLAAFQNVFIKAVIC